MPENSYLCLMKQEFFNLSLRDRNSFGVEQQAAHLIEFETTEDLRELFSEIKPERWMVLSGGNNILFTKDYDGLLITPVAQKIEVVERDDHHLLVRVDAGLEWDDLVAWTVEQGAWGLENLSLIPGKVGAAPVQNIGAYGAEAKDCLERVECYLPEEDRVVELDRKACRFGYRESIFKQELKGRTIITAVWFRLSLEACPNLGYGDLKREVEARGGATLKHIREAVVAIRQSKLPDTAVLGNAGSFFKNPVVDRALAEALLERYPEMPHYPSAEGPARVKLAAGWLIDQCGLKGYRSGAVGVHDRQALVLVNYGGASGGEVIELARYVQDRVKTRFGVEISPEVNIL